MNIIENLKNPKKRAITQLVLYGIFFIFVFIIISIKDNSVSNYQDNIDNKDKQEVISNNISEYQYTFYINETTIYGNIVDNQNTFIINNITYKKINNSTYNANTMEEVADFSIDKYLYTNIEKLIENSEFIEKTTFKDNSEKTTYLVKDTTYCIECNMVVEKSDYISKVTIGDNIELNYEM